MPSIAEVIASIKIEDRKVARYGKHHLTARGAAEHATYSVLGPKCNWHRTEWQAVRKQIEDALVAKGMKRC